MRRASPRLILCIAWVVALLYAYPGYMTTDSVNQLTDARIGGFVDWSPALMTEVWRLLGYVWSGPASMLVLQVTLFLVGTYHVLREALQPRTAAVVAGVVTWMPPVLATLGVIWPQSLHAALAISTLALVRRGTWRAWLAAMPLAVLACSLGFGSAISMLAIIAGGTHRRLAPRWWHRLVGVAVWAVVALAAHGANIALTDLATHQNDIALAKDDIAGIVERAQLPADPMINADPHTPAEIDALLADHARLIRAYPLAYVHERVARASYLLGVKRRRTWSPVYTEFLGSRDQLMLTHHFASHSWLQGGLVAIVTAAGRTLLCHPWLYAVLALLLLPFAILARGPAWVLLASGLSGELAMLTETNSAELRYSVWLIASTLIALALVIAVRSARQTRRR